MSVGDEIEEGEILDDDVEQPTTIIHNEIECAVDRVDRNEVAVTRDGLEGGELTDCYIPYYQVIDEIGTYDDPINACCEQDDSSDKLPVADNTSPSNWPEWKKKKALTSSALSGTTSNTITVSTIRILYIQTGV
jgi:hypothetical protein